MGIKANTKGLKAAGTRLRNTGLEIMRDAARECQRKAQAEAPVDTGELKQGIVIIPNSKGATVVSTANYSSFLEYGTGVYGERPGRKTPWVYLHPEYGFITTSGAPAQSFMRPGFREGVDTFHDLKRRHGL